MSSISSAMLYKKDHDDNEIAADNKYKGNKFVLFGTIGSINKDMTGRAYLVLSTGNRGFDAGVHAVLASSEREYAATLGKGAEIHLVCESSIKIGPVASAKNCKEVSRFLSGSNLSEVISKFIYGKKRLEGEDAVFERFFILSYAFGVLLEGTACHSDMQSEECESVMKNNLDYDNMNKIAISLAEQLGVKFEPLKKPNENEKK